MTTTPAAPETAPSLDGYTLVGLHSGFGSMSEAADAVALILVPNAIAADVAAEFYRQLRTHPDLAHAKDELWLTQEGAMPVADQSVAGYAQALLNETLDRYGD